MNRAVIIGAAVALLAIGGGVAFAATQAQASGGTNVCVNDANGLVRVADSCRVGEHPLTIGGGVRRRSRRKVPSACLGVRLAPARLCRSRA